MEPKKTEPVSTPAPVARTRPAPTERFDPVQAASDIKLAVSPGFTGLGTEEAVIFETLDRRSSAQRIALRAEYRRQTSSAGTPEGRNMDSDILDELSNYDLYNGYTGWLDRARFLLSGHQSEADAIGLYQAMRGGHTGLGVDQKQVFDILERQASMAQRQGLERAYAAFVDGETLRQRLSAELSGPELDRALALIDGDVSRARAAELRYAMKGGLTGWGVDSETVFRRLRTDADGRPLSARQLQRIVQAYERLYGSGQPIDEVAASQLAADVRDEFWAGPHLDRALSLLRGDFAGADAARAKAALHGDGWTVTFWDGWGTDEASLDEAVRGRIDEVSRAYDAKYGRGAFDRHRRSELSVQEFDGNEEIGNHGEPSVARRLWNATDGWGTDEDAVLAALGGPDGLGLSRSALERTRRAFESLALKYTGTRRDLDRTLDAELSGRPDFDAKQLLDGHPQTVDAEVRRFRQSYRWERTGWRNAIANGLNGLANDKGGQLDHAAAAVTQAYDAARSDGRVTRREAETLRRLMETGRANRAAYRNARDGAADTAGSVATTAAVIGATAAVTVLTGGTATAPTIAAWAALAGATTNLTTRCTVNGPGYQAEDAVVDLTVGGLEGATVGLGPGKWAASPAMKKLGQTAAGRVVARTTVGMAEGMKGGAIMGGGTAALDGDTWQDGAFPGAVKVGRNTVAGAGTGGLTGGAVANVLPPLLARIKQRTTPSVIPPAPKLISNEDQFFFNDLHDVAPAARGQLRQMTASELRAVFPEGGPYPVSAAWAAEIDGFAQLAKHDPAVARAFADSLDIYGTRLIDEFGHLGLVPVLRRVLDVTPTRAPHPSNPAFVVRLAPPQRPSWMPELEVIAGPALDHNGAFSQRAADGIGFTNAPRRVVIRPEQLIDKGRSRTTFDGVAIFGAHANARGFGPVSTRAAADLMFESIVERAAAGRKIDTVVLEACHQRNLGVDLRSNAQRFQRHLNARLAAAEMPKVTVFAASRPGKVYSGSRSSQAAVWPTRVPRVRTAFTPASAGPRPTEAQFAAAGVFVGVGMLAAAGAVIYTKVVTSDDSEGGAHLDPDREAE